MSLVTCRQCGLLRESSERCNRCGWRPGDAIEQINNSTVGYSAEHERLKQAQQQLQADLSALRSRSWVSVPAARYAWPARLTTGESITAGQFLRLDHQDMVRRAAQLPIIGVAARDLREGEIIDYNPLANTPDVIVRASFIAPTTDQADVTCPACREWMAAIQDLQKELAAMRSRSWITVPLTATTATAGETIYPGEAAFIDRDGLVRLTDREEAARRARPEDMSDESVVAHSPDNSDAQRS